MQIQVYRERTELSVPNTPEAFIHVGLGLVGIGLLWRLFSK